MNNSAGKSIYAPAPRTARPAVTAAFLIQGMMLATILSELPSIRNDLGATDGLLALMIGVVSALAAIGSVISEKLAEKKNSATTLTLAIALLVLGAVGVALNQGTASFIAAVAIYGLGVGGVDAAGNMQAASLQKRAGKVIISSFFAAWSGGAIIGAVLGSAGEALIGAQHAYRIDIATIAGLAAALGWLASRHFLRTGPQPVVDLNPMTAVMPWRPIVLVGIAMALFYAVDFGLSNWSPLFLHDILLADPSTAALGVASYQVAGFVSRLFADRLVRRHGATVVMRSFALLAVLGMLLTVLANAVPMALFGLALVGLGVSVTAPLCFSTAAKLTPMEKLDVAIARLNLFNYMGTVVGGVVIGTVLALTNARAALVIPLACCVGLIFFARAFRGGATTPDRGATASERVAASNDRGATSPDSGGATPLWRWKRHLRSHHHPGKAPLN